MKQLLGNFRMWLGLVVGVGLIALAGYWAAPALEFAMLGQVPITGLLLLALLVGVHLLVTAWLFHEVTRFFACKPTVSYPRMFSLIAASSLLNYIPWIRPGLWGRAAFLKAHHQLAIRSSLAILGIVLVLAVVATALVLLSGLVGMAILAHEQHMYSLVLLFVLTAIASWMTPTLLRWVFRQRRRQSWLWLPIRMLDLWLGAWRLWLAMSLLGMPSHFYESLLAVSVASLVRLTGITPNGLGLSDWVTAFVLTLVQPATLAQAAAAAILDRMMEIIVVMVLGTASLLHLSQVKAPAPAQASEAD